MAKLGLRYTFFLWLLIISSKASANLIIDSETDSVINELILPLKKQCHCENLKIVIFKGNQIATFAVTENLIFVSSKLITEYPDPDIFIAIIAHEIGHIKARNYINRDDELKQYLASQHNILPLAMMHDNVMQKVSQELNANLSEFRNTENTIYTYSRKIEFAADQFALLALEKAGQSSVGLIKFYEYQINNIEKNIINAYNQLHPIGKDRLIILKSFNKRSGDQESQIDKKLYYKFARLSAKLAAYLDEDIDFTKINKNYLSEIKSYYKAITNFKNKKFDNAFDQINKALSKNGRDPFYHEMKGQILYHWKKKSALHEFDIALENRQNDPLLRLERGAIGYELYKSKPKLLANYYDDLDYNIKHGEKNVAALFYMAKYCEANLMHEDELLMLANIGVITHNYTYAKKMASLAQKNLNPSVREWYKANEIIRATNK